jgi:hypothetical protein
MCVGRLIRFTSFLFALTIISNGCKEEETILIEPDAYHYLFLGHSYQWHTIDRIDYRLEQIDFNAFDGIWLGGDLCAESTREEYIVEYLDNLFNLGSMHTHWSLGNHDTRNGNIPWITNRTERKTYYTTSAHGITIVVLNTSLGTVPALDPACEAIAEQYHMFNSVLDTISESSHLVVISHHVVWGKADEETYEASTLGNVHIAYYRFLCDSTIFFHNHFYPKFKEARDRGVEIIFISGDGGQRTKGLEHTSEPGIHFFISGINNSVDTLEWPQANAFNFNPDSILLFDYYHKEKRMDWRFINLNEYVEK